MVEITLKELRDRNLIGAVERLKNEFVDLRTATKLLTISRALREEQVKAQELYELLLKKHYEPHSDPEEKKKGIWQPKDGNVEACNNVMREFEATRVRFKFPKLKMEELGNVKIKALELEGLSPLLEGFDEQKEDEKSKDKKKK
jgi:hypothetical protein